MPDLDIGTILYAVSILSAIRGYTMQSKATYFFASAAAITFVLQAIPGIVGSAEFYNHSNFQDWNTCWNYFYSGLSMKIRVVLVLTVHVMI